MQQKNENSGRKNILYLLALAIITVVIWQIPEGRYVLYPFTILGTWFHEMGHGIAAVVLGGSFERLEIYSNGSGLAVHSGGLFLGDIGRSLVAAAGPIGPTIAGSVFILASGNRKSARLALLLLSILLIVSAVFYVRPVFDFGFLIIMIFGVVSLVISFVASDGLKRLMIQFLGIQAFLSLYLSIGYLFSVGANVGGESYLSDTAQIQKYLFLPYWLWGGLILLFSVFLIFFSVRSILKQR